MVVGHIAGIPVEEMLQAAAPFGGIAAALAAAWYERGRRRLRSPGGRRLRRLG
jgi:hypothetical protein